MLNSFQDEMDVRHALLEDAGIHGLSEECIAETTQMAYFDELYSAFVAVLRQNSEEAYFYGVRQSPTRNSRNDLAKKRAR